MSFRLDEQLWQNGLDHLRPQEPALAALFDRFPSTRVEGSGNPYQVLVNAIIGQQISVTAAAAIFGRLEALLSTWDPARVAKVSDAELRTAGLSLRKVEYLRSLADAFVSGRVKPETWEGAPDAEVTRQLVTLRGIGPWTAEMFLIFQLHRSDVLPLADIGLLKSAAREFGWNYPFDPERLRERAEAWRPFRTVAVWHLWRTLDPVPVVY